MQVLALNCGSSSLKFRLFAVPGKGGSTAIQRAEVGGEIKGIGSRTIARFQVGDASPQPHELDVHDHEEAVQWVCDQLRGRTIDAVGHRIVHGGEAFVDSVRIDADVLAQIEQLSALAPLHNPACAVGIRGTRKCLGEQVPMVAVFDTAFHRSMPEYAATYAIPHELAARHGIKRYGFHGIAHASLVERYCVATGTTRERARAITLQLGNGCSAAAIGNGRSVDTSMGFTPLEGLVMGTRSGDLDPAIVSYVAKHEGIPAAAVEQLLNEQSGLRGVSGLSHDMAALLQAAQHHHPRARLAIDLFCYRVRKYIGAYLAVLGGADALIFGGGIGEHAAEIRARICADMEWCGLALDPVRNVAAVGLTAGDIVRISRDGAGLAAYVAAVDEETEIVRETVRCLEKG